MHDFSHVEERLKLSEETRRRIFTETGRNRGLLPEGSTWGDLRLIEKTYRKSGLKKYFEESCPGLPFPGSNRGYSDIDMI